MPKKKRKSVKKTVAKRNKEIIKFFITGFLVLCLIILVFTIYKIYQGNVSRIASQDEKSSLQLEVFNPSEASPPTPPPTFPPPAETGSACNHDNGIPAELNNGKPVKDPSCFCPAFLIECKDKKCANLISYKGKPVDPKYACDYGKTNLGGYGIADSYCGTPGLAPTDGIFCIGKPVIYLYPTKPTFVKVTVQTAGSIFISDPPYPTSGWENLLAYPNGKIEYRGKSYRELFYESNVKDVKRPSSGMTLDSRNLRTELDSIITKLGLINEEKTEFLDFWIPKLQNLNSNYIFFSLVEKDEKDRIDKVNISPKPDTTIEFIAYFAPLDHLFEGVPLDLPENPPARIGFTAVEWGGMMGK